MRSPDAGPARDYLRSRGYDGDVVRQFRLGWAPDDWDAMATSLKLPENVLSDAGSRLRQPARPRAGLLPGPRAVPDLRSVRAARSRSADASCRPAPGQAPSDRPEAKYKNSQESPIYSKRRTLYALNWAKKGVIAQGEVVVCEGYTDVIGSFQAGVPWAVATCGTALAEEHFTLLRNFAKRIVLAYDADAAGQSATSRVYEWERKHEVDVVVADLPGGSDPGELARTDPTALARAIKEARPFLQFRVDRMLKAGDLTHRRGPGPGRRGGPDGGGRAPRRPGAGPVRHAAGRPLPRRLGQAPGAARVPARPSAGGEAGPRTRGSQDEPPLRDYPEDDGDLVAPDGGRSGSSLTHSAPTWAWARGTQVGRAPTRRCSGSSARRSVHRPRATPGVPRALGARQRARSGRDRVTGGGQPVATRHSRRADVGRP